ncbi:hypothetical protein D3C81_1332500 [compost metagenome]
MQEKDAGRLIEKMDESDTRQRIMSPVVLVKDPKKIIASCLADNGQPASKQADS